MPRRPLEKSSESSVPWIIWPATENAVPPEQKLSVAHVDPPRSMWGEEASPIATRRIFPEISPGEAEAWNCGKLTWPPPRFHRFKTKTDSTNTEIAKIEAAAKNPLRVTNFFLKAPPS